MNTMPTTTMTIREAGPGDYERICTVVNANYPDYPETPANLEHRDAHKDPKCLQKRWIGEVDGRAAAFGSYGQFEWMYHPKRFSIRVMVLPELQGQGLGTAMYNTVMEALRPFEPESVRAYTQENRPRALRFLNQRGFEEEERDYESRLDVTAFDFTPYEGVVENVLDQGIRICTLADLENDPERDRKVWEMEIELMKDVPFPPDTEQTPMPFEIYREYLRSHPARIPEAFFIALDGDQYVGTSAVIRILQTDNLDTGLTAVRRDYRRRGIALALKLCAIRFARDHGHPVIRTDNNTSNRPMLSINERLGFVKQPAWIGFKKTLRDE